LQGESAPPSSVLRELIEERSLDASFRCSLDAELTLRGLKNQKVANKITWLKDGAEALDYVFRRNAYADRENKDPGITGSRSIEGSDALRPRRPQVLIAVRAHSGI
jgi:hypothetical protein